MKNLAKLALFLSISFIGILLVSGLTALQSDWTSLALTFPPDSGILGIFYGNILDYLGSSLSTAFYVTILLGITYAARRRIYYPAAFGIILIFVLVLSGTVYLGLDNLEKANFSLAVKSPLPAPAKPGLIVSHGMGDGNQLVFLNNPYQSEGPVVLKYGKAPLGYQSRAPLLGKSSLPFYTEKKGVFESIKRDFDHSSRVFFLWYRDSLVSYGVYAGSLAIFLISLGCLIDISFWSLANLIFGALAFRGVLALENFLNQGNIQDILVSFTRKIIHPSLINPVIFCTLAFLILLYSGLVYLARGRINDG